MIIRMATSGDAVQIAHCLLQAMEEIAYRMIGERSASKAFDFMYRFVSTTQNQYSYTLCRVVEKNGVVVAAANVYDGAQLTKLRQPVIDYLSNLHSTAIPLEDETGEGEYYLDSLGVVPEHRGQGIGTALLSFIFDEFVIRCQQTLGLLVEEDNYKARALYDRLHFKAVGKKVLLGKTLDHLQVKNSGALS